MKSLILSGGPLASVMLAFFFAPDASAFPEMIRHSYVNCMTCHVSQGGGGLLTDYGREMSKEILSRWSGEKEHQPLQGLLDEETLGSFLKVGGDVRYAQVHSETPTVIEGRWVFMHADLELGWVTEEVSVVVAGGAVSRGGQTVTDVRRAYIGTMIGAAGSVQAGLFTPTFGIGTPDHVVNVKRSLGFESDRERLTAEGALLGESWIAYGGVSRSRDRIVETRRESAGHLVLLKVVGDSLRTGPQFWKGKSDDFERDIIGWQGLWGFLHNGALWFEIDRENRRDSRETVRSDIAVVRGSWELTKGLVGFGQRELTSRSKPSGSDSANTTSVGLQFYPRPHFEFSGTLSRTKSSQISQDLAFLLVHYYF